MQYWGMISTVYLTVGVGEKQSTPTAAITRTAVMSHCSRPQGAVTVVNQPAGDQAALQHITIWPVSRWYIGAIQAQHLSRLAKLRAVMKLYVDECT